MKKHRYLFAKYLAKPRDPSKTHIKGYMSNPENVRYDELVGFSVGLKKKDQDNQIILDIDGQKVIKNSMNENTDWSQLMNYFLGAYEKQLLDFMRKTGGVATESVTIGTDQTP
jgi:hypothetical protein